MTVQRCSEATWSGCVLPAAAAFLQALFDQLCCKSAADFVIESKALFIARMQDTTAGSRRFFNALAEEPETVAAVLAPRLRAVQVWQCWGRD